jgi:septal ring factor EnvC (AmiA/AmiB activator)
MTIKAIPTIISLMTVIFFAEAMLVSSLVVDAKMNELNKSVSNLKHSSTEDDGIKEILNKLPKDLKNNNDFDKLNELLDELKNRIYTLQEDNEDLGDDIKELKEELNDLQVKVTSMGIVVGIY